MELFYLEKGLLIPNFHKSYWMGLTSSPADPTFFTWIDGTPTPGIDRRYQHWGKLRMSDRNAPRVPEPNNMEGDEYCAVSNSSMVFGPSWGWADTSCNGSYPAICKIPRGLAAHLLRLPAGALCERACREGLVLMMVPAASSPATSARCLQPPPATSTCPP